MRQIRIMSMNLKDDGDGSTDAWRRAMSMVTKHRVDILLRQQMSRSHENGLRLLHEAEDLLRMRGFLTHHPEVRHSTGLFVNLAKFRVTAEWDHRCTRTFRIPPTNVTVRLRSRPEVDISLVSWHLTYNSSHRRAVEADELTTLVDLANRGQGFIGGGDCNEAPVPDGEPLPDIDWGMVTDHPYMVQRTLTRPDGSRRTSVEVDRTLRASGAVDVARYFDPDGSRGARAGTTNHYRGDRGGPVRADRIYMDRWSVQAVTSVEVVDAGPLADHKAVLVTLDEDRFGAALGREFDPVDLW